MELTQEQMARLKAQSSVGGGAIRLPILDRISLNGDCAAKEDANGNLSRPPIAYKKMLMKNKDKDTKAEEIPIGSPIEVIFVKVRRRLVAKDKDGKQIMSTSQHATKDQVVTLWKEGKCIDTAPASELREKYQGLKTIQEVYVLLSGELNLLIVKGSAFGSEVRDPKLPNFYKYLQNISKDGIFMTTTILGGVKESGKMEYYTMTFEKGRPTTPEEQLTVLNNSDMLTSVIADYDRENKAGAKTITEDESLNQTAQADEYEAMGEEGGDLSQTPF